MQTIIAQVDHLSEELKIERVNKPPVKKKYLVVTLESGDSIKIEFRGSKNKHLLRNLKRLDQVKIIYSSNVRKDKNGSHHQNNIGIQIERL